SQVETSLQEPGSDGLSAQLAKFWSNWSDLAANPTSSGARQALYEQANTVVESLHSLDSQLTSAATQASAEYTSLTQSGGEIDQDAAQIASLNTAIKTAVAAGDHPNDLMDKRDQLLDKLSGLGRVSVTDLGSGSIQVTVPANTLVASSATGTGDTPAQTANRRASATDSAYSAYVTRIGSMTQDPQRKEATAQALVNSVEASRQSTSGVSMDEEMT